MEKLYIKPADCFFFRGHSDFTLGENSSATGIFPPRPGTLYGALRSAYIHHHIDFSVFQKGENETVKRWMGTPREKGRFQVYGSFLVEAALTKEEKVIYPLPIDYQVVQSNKENEPNAFALELNEEAIRTSDESSVRLCGPVDEKSESSENRFLYEEDLKRALFHESGLTAHTASRWVETEEKLGIAINRETGRTEKSMLYDINQLRFKKRTHGFVVLGKETPDFSDVRYLRLGGGNHPATLETDSKEGELLSDGLKSRIIERLKETGVGRIVLLTPAIWELGSRPGCFHKGKLRLHNSLELELLTACVGRPMIVGGWDIQRRRPKDRVNAVPAGSVLYVRVRPEDAETFVEMTYFGQLSDDLCEEGYGLTVPGVSEFKH